MKTKILFIFLSLILAGCSTLEKDLQKAIDLSSKVGNIEYERRGFWSNSDFDKLANADGTFRIHYRVTGKVPGGPSVDITVDGIKP